MRKSLLMTAALLGLVGAGGLDTALAQTAAPDSTAPATSQPARRRAVVPRRSQSQVDAPAASDDGVAPPTSAYRGGASVPLSQRASNIGNQTGRSEIAPRLPTPETAGNTPEALLRAAQRSLGQNKTGAAQQALEMAETRGAEPHGGPQRGRRARYGGHGAAHRRSPAGAGRRQPERGAGGHRRSPERARAPARARRHHRSGRGTRIGAARILDKSPAWLTG